MLVSVRIGAAIARIVRDATGRPWLTIATVLGLTLGLLYYTATHFAVNTDTAGMIDGDVPFRRAQESFKRAFPQDIDAIVAVIDGHTPEAVDRAARALGDRLAADRHVQEARFFAGDPFFRRNAFLYLEKDRLDRLLDDLAAAAPLLGMLTAQPNLVGLAAAFEAILGGDIDAGADARLETVVRQMTATVAARGAGHPQPLSWQSLVTDADSAAPPRAIVLIRPVVDFTRLRPTAEAIAATRAAAAAVRGESPEPIEIRLTGPAALAADEMRSAATGALAASIVSILLVVLLMVVGLRRAWPVATTLITLAVGVIVTAGLAMMTVGHFNLISITFAVLFIGLGIDFGIHFALAAEDEGRRDADWRATLARAGAEVGPALALAALGAAIGFFSVLPTAYRGLAELGLISGLGMMVALGTNLTLLPALLAVGPPPRPARRGRPGAASGQGLPPKVALTIAAVLTVGAAFTLPAVRFDADPLHLRNPADESVRAFHDLAATPSTSPYVAELIAPDLAVAQDWAARLSTLPEVATVITTARFIPAEQRAKLAAIDTLALFLGPVVDPPAVAEPPTDAERLRTLAELAGRAEHAAAGRLRTAVKSLTGALLSLGTDELPAAEGDLFNYLPDLRTRLELALEAAEIGPGDLPEWLRARWIAADGRARVQVRPRASVATDAVAMADFADAVARISPHPAGTAALIVGAARTVKAAFLEASVIAFAGILILLLIALRSLRDTALVLLPLVVAGVLTAASAVVLGLAFNFANVIVLPLLLGLGVASGIHLVLRARNSAEDVFRTSTPRAVVFSALTTIASFASLALSPHRGMASMGILLTAAIFWTLVSSLIVLPAIMRLKGRR